MGEPRLPVHESRCVLRQLCEGALLTSHLCSAIVCGKSANYYMFLPQLLCLQNDADNSTYHPKVVLRWL